MVAREYVGAGGMRLHLDEPLAPEMAAQVDRGELRLVEDGEPLFDPDRSVQPQVIQHGADAPAATRVGRNVRLAPDRPEPDDHAGTWATYAVSLGLLATKASTMTKSQLIEWVEAVEDVDTGVVGDAGEGVEGPDHAAVDGRPNDAHGEPAPLEVATVESTEPPVDTEGTDSSSDVSRPKSTDEVADWRAYAVSLGMPEDEATAATKQELQDWVQVHEDANSGSEG
ncbi:hypothetical protein ADL07_11550 [Streptomyces sp. NRRL F-4707]|uniref:hypothetical protein n=1 Tax=Streptomyces sp. NRRL F-4707 TaxID=1519496 RepID=UPI0006AF2AE1|nr:hypothetical protein [Streptomyces sp. NRRL F-4707]KOX32800.1 hypothetical protein ADL07_11550 [Streptomyces sp. NRRL F-4707]